MDWTILPLLTQLLSHLSRERSTLWQCQGMFGAGKMPAAAVLLAAIINPFQADVIWKVKFVMP